jgi:peptidoglycan/LPS O-acetylase OafA/YrhL
MSEPTNAGHEERSADGAERPGSSLRSTADVIDRASTSTPTLIATSSSIATASRPGNNFDFLRLFLAALVIYAHSYAIAEGNEDGEVLYRIFGIQLFNLHMTLGTFAVGGFFVISGYLITASWERRKSIGEYFRKRIGRIYPGFVVCNLIGAFLIPYVAIQGDAWQHLDPARVIGQTAILRGIGHPEAFGENILPGVTNGSLWSIAYEFGCYVMIALLGWSGLAARGVWLVALLVLSLVVSFAFAQQGWRFFIPGIGHIVGEPMFWARLLPYYLIGVVAWRYRDRIRYGNIGAVAAIALLTIGGLVPLSWSVLLPVAGAYLIFWFAFHGSIRIRGTARYGDFSYGTYLYGFPIQQLCVQAWGGSMNPLLLCAISLPLSILAGAISWHAVEKWFLRRARPVDIRATTGAVPT